MTPTPPRKPIPSSTNGPATAKADDIDRKKFPNLAAERDWDREQHIQQAMQSGMTRKQAERHADAELREG